VRWLGRLRHDLVKRMLWPARDRRDAGGTAGPGELVPTLVDDEGGPIEAAALWALLRADAPAGAPSAALDRFGEEVVGAARAAMRSDLEGVLALEGAFDELARIVNGDSENQPTARRGPGDRR
jgi:hypothetical protein